MKLLNFDRRDCETLWPVGIFLALIAVIGLFVHFDVLEPQAVQMHDQFLSPSTSLPTGKEIEVGAYIENIYLFSASDKTFDVDGWIWVNWPQEAEDLFQAKKLTPDKWLNFVNQVDEWDSKIEPFYDEPIKLDNGHYYQGYKFSGHFYVNDIQFQKFPFQTVKLPLVFELADFAEINLKTTDMHDLHLVPDKSSSGIGAYIDITGYKTIDFNIFTNIHEYGSDFGLKKINPKHVHTNQIVFETSYKPSVNAALLTLFLPLLIVMTLVLFSPMLSASLWDIRLGVPPTALLTLIFLQQIHKDKLPELPYITYLDMIYNICYFIILILFVLFLWGSNRLDRATEEEKPAIIEHIDEIDNKFQISLTIFLFVLSVASWFLLYR